MPPFVSSFWRAGELARRISVRLAMLAAALWCAAANAVTLAPGDVLAVDFGLDGIYRIDPATGNRTVVTGLGVGGGPVLVQPRGLAVDATGQIYIVDSTLQAVLKVDPASGNRAIISRAGVTTGPALAAPVSIALDGAGHALVADLDLDAVVCVDLASGARTILSDATQGGGPILGNPTGVAVALDGRILVSDQDLLALVAVDAATGDRSIVSSTAVGGGPPFSSPMALALRGDEAIVSDISQTVFSTNIGSGGRTPLSGAGVGAGPELMDVRGVAPGPARGFYVADEDLKAVLYVDAAGNRSVFSSAARGTGFTFSMVEAIAVVGAIVPEPNAIALTASVLAPFALISRRRASS